MHEWVTFDGVKVVGRCWANTACEAIDIFSSRGLTISNVQRDESRD